MWPCHESAAAGSSHQNSGVEPGLFDVYNYKMPRLRWYAASPKLALMRARRVHLSRGVTSVSALQWIKSSSSRRGHSGSALMSTRAVQPPKCSVVRALEPAR